MSKIKDNQNEPALGYKPGMEARNWIHQELYLGDRESEAGL